MWPANCINIHQLCWLKCKMVNPLENLYCNIGCCGYAGREMHNVCPYCLLVPVDAFVFADDEDSWGKGSRM